MNDGNCVLGYLVLLLFVCLLLQFYFDCLLYIIVVVVVVYVCACVRTRARVCVCVRARARVLCVRVCVRERERGGAQTHLCLAEYHDGRRILVSCCYLFPKFCSTFRNLKHYCESKAKDSTPSIAWRREAWKEEVLDGP